MGIAMKGLKDTLANLSRLRDRFERLLSSAAKRGGGGIPVPIGRLRDVADFGSNAGSLRMLTYVPPNLTKDPALVVALHGCTQTAAVYDHGSGWSRLADTCGFAVLFPEQQRANNPNNCFNWFLPSDIRRDHGEALSIRQMIERMIRDHGIDRRRVFIVGLSAGGAMASGMLATYPDVFAGGAIIAGLPYGSATNVQEAFEAMAKGRERSAQEWGDLVRDASPHRGRWPKISVWHGTSDAIVNPRNMEDVLKQWVDVHGVSVRPRIEHEIEVHPRRVWRTEADDDVIEAITITGMGHGVPVASACGVDSYGHAGPFHFDVGLSSSHHIIRFWGLADECVAGEHEPSSEVRSRLVPAEEDSHGTASLAARGSAFEGSTAGEQGPAEVGQVLDPRAVIAAALKAAGLLSEPGGHPSPSNPLDPRRIITRTLRSVGVLKE
jgi:poly(hydroxyalkanoate) depolymerase family esterase